jgi:hypothetical protein
MVQTCSYFSCERSGLGKTIITKTNSNLEEKTRVPKMASWTGNIRASKKAKLPHSQFPTRREKRALTKKRVPEKEETKNNTLQPLAILRLGSQASARGWSHTLASIRQLDGVIEFGQ